MLRNYIILAFRHLKRKKGFAFINIAGMGISLTVVLVILQYVVQETSYDKFHTNADRIYRVVSERTVEGRKVSSSPDSPSALTIEVAAQVPEVQSYVRIEKIDYTNVSLTYKEGTVLKQVFQKNFFLADSTFFDVFSFELTSGSRQTALSNPDNIVLASTVAEKLFGNEDPVGKTIEMGNNWGTFTFQVAGVMQDAPFNSHISPAAVIPVTFYDRIGVKYNDWTYGVLNSYLVLKSPMSQPKVEQAFHSIYQQNRPEGIKARGINFGFSLQPLADVHLHSDLDNDIAKTGNADYVLFISIVGALVLLISWVNYVNLSTAQSVERAREVGIRKVFGSQKIQLVTQFLLESFLVNGVSIVIALTLAQTVLQRLGNWTGIDVRSTLISQPQFWLALLSFWVVASFFAGFYPAFVLSRFQPSKVLGGRFKSQSGGIFLRRCLVVFQFSISALLIAGTLTVYRQISFMRAQELGIDISDVVVLKSPPAATSDGDFNKKVNFFKTELLRHPQFASMTTASTMPGHAIGWTSTKFRRKGTSEDIGSAFSLVACDKDYLNTLSIGMVTGEFFKGSENPWVSGEIVINRKAAEVLGFSSPEEALYQHVTCPIFDDIDLRIIGVTEDYHHEALQAPIAPVVYALSTWSNYYMVRMDIQGEDAQSRSASLQTALSLLESTWKESFPQSTFDYAFLDEQFNQQYKADEQFGTLFSLFAGFAIFIGCLGLFGLASFMLHQRTKEIGIRKVLGAGYQDVTLLVSREFLVLVLVGNLVAMPLGWWLLTGWLEGYAYRISLGWWFVALPLVILASLTMLTIVFQVLKAVRMNPVESLRYE